ncbi:MAG: sensor histidine kinase, partial [Actinomycetota bacterium]
PRIEIGSSREANKVVFHISDNGEGIGEEQQEKVFKPFVRSSVTQPQGLGIGLSTVRRAVEAWRGEVWVKSAPGEGSTFFFTVPASY